MSARSVAAVLLGASAVCLGVGCGDPRLIGVTCDEDGCAPRPARFETCMERELTPRFVEPEANFANVCHLFTLDELTTPPGSDHAFLSAARAEGMPLGHDIDMRMAADVPFADGRYEGDACLDILSKPVDWVPLMVTVGESDTWSFEAAPLVAQRGHRLLVIDSFENLSAKQTVETRVSVRLSCAVERPALVTRAVRFGGRRVGGSVQARGVAEVDASCTWLEPASIARLYRRDRLTSTFSVQTPGAPDGASPLWLSDHNYDWSHDLAEPLDLEDGARLSWSCRLFNERDTPFAIPPEEFDACMLFGFVRVPDGAEPPELRGCDDATVMEF